MIQKPGVTLQSGGSNRSGSIASIGGSGSGGAGGSCSGSSTPSGAGSIVGMSSGSLSKMQPGTNVRAARVSVTHSSSPTRPHSISSPR